MAKWLVPARVNWLKVTTFWNIWTRFRMHLQLPTLLREVFFFPSCTPWAPVVGMKYSSPSMTNRGMTACPSPSALATRLSETIWPLVLMNIHEECKCRCGKSEKLTKMLSTNYILQRIFVQQDIVKPVLLVSTGLTMSCWTKIHPKYALQFKIRFYFLFCGGK